MSGLETSKLTRGEKTKKTTAENPWNSDSEIRRDAHRRVRVYVAMCECMCVYTRTKTKVVSKKYPNASLYAQHTALQIQLDLGMGIDMISIFKSDYFLCAPHL